jgi:hypothetical protein
MQLPNRNVYTFDTLGQGLLPFAQTIGGTNVAKSNEQHLDEAVLAAVEAAKKATKGRVTRLTVDIGSAAEYPYRLDQPDEQWGLVGLARPQS